MRTHKAKNGFIWFSYVQRAQMRPMLNRRVGFFTFGEGPNPGLTQSGIKKRIPQPTRTGSRTPVGYWTQVRRFL